MKRLLLISILTFVFFDCSAQNENISINRPDKILFVGYDNLLVVGFKDSIIQNLTVKCDCDKIIREPRGYVIPVSKVGPINILFYDGDKLLQTMMFKAVLPPAPQILFNDTIPLDKLDASAKYFNLKMPEYLPLNPTYQISGWTMELGKKTFKGLGKDLTPELIQYIAKLKKVTPVKLSIEYSAGGKHFDQEFILNN